LLVRIDKDWLADHPRDGVGRNHGLRRKAIRIATDR
jgi:hypothetical protein